MLGGAPFSIALPLSQCIVPDGVDGPVAIWVTSDGQPLINNVRDRATNKQIAGPTIAFIDTKSEMIGQLARGASVNNGSGSGGEATSTETISPDQASSILASATATASDAGATDVSNSSTDGLPPTANTETGPSPDGKTTVNGWSTTPA